MDKKIEAVLAEKFEMISSCNIANTCPRDFYDAYILYSLRGEECNTMDAIYEIV